MGAHRSREKAEPEPKPAAQPRPSLASSSSAADLQGAARLAPVDKLSKILSKRAHDEEGVSGATERSFTVHLFPKYPELGARLFRHLLALSKSKARHLTSSQFRQQSERFLGIMDDAVVIETYVRMFSDAEEEEAMAPEGLRTLLMTCYKLSMDHYSEGPRSCFAIHRTLTAVIDSCFHHKRTLSANYISRWLSEHCHRVVLPMHRYCVHILSTAWRNMDTDVSEESSGLELATPVLETPPSGVPCHSAPLLPVSQAWLLAGSLPPIYSLPHSSANNSGNSGTNLASVQFLSRLVCLLPSHWTMLYASNEHGLGSNRFLHHVLAYHGPTLVLLLGGNIKNQGVADELVDRVLLCVASPVEWRESHLYAGGPESALIQMQPKFGVLEMSPKMLYLNTHIRGYPKGLRAGSDPRKPLMAIDEGFEKFEFRGIKYPIEAMEVWGCGDQASRETQLEIKTWQFKEAERQRQVKLSAADWMDHPDRYLLELAGRPQYNNSAN